jgi:predicted HicB family RNase H-like nuclease
MHQKGVDVYEGEFGLQLSEPLREEAAKAAEREGVSLENFILIAISEKVVDQNEG